MKNGTWIGLGIGLVAGVVVLALLVKFGPSSLGNFLSFRRQVPSPSADLSKRGSTTAQSPVRVVGGSITFEGAAGWTAIGTCNPTFGTLDTCGYAASFTSQPSNVIFEGLDNSGRWTAGMWPIVSTWEVDVTPVAANTGAANGAPIKLCSSPSLSSTTCGPGIFALLQVTQPSDRLVGLYAHLTPPYQNDPVRFRRYHDPIGCNATAGEFCEHISQVAITIDGTAISPASTPCANGQCAVTVY